MDFLKGEILIINKPLNWTSFDVVNKIRYQLKQKLKVKKIKVGHAGTLDPLATGVLVICTGKKTKEINSFINDDKAYKGIIQLGSTTPSFDLETPIDNTYPTEQISDKKIEELEAFLIGEHLQEPPIFSAKKINGRRAYELARKGKVVKLKKSNITIKNISLKLLDNNKLAFKISCSKGTYIRALARDIGTKLDSGAHLIELVRTASGNFNLSQAKDINTCLSIIDSI